MSETLYDKLVPSPTADTKPYWDGLMAGGSLFNPTARVGAEGVSDLLDNFSDSGGACCYGALEKHPKLQNVLTKAVESVKEHFHVATRTQEETVRAREAKAPGAKAACLAQPRSRETTLPPDAAKFASTYRLGTATAHDLGHCPSLRYRFAVYKPYPVV